MSRLPPTRRAILAGAGSAVTASLAGCALTGDEGSGGDGVDEEFILTFHHPETVRSDEPFDMTIEGLPANTEVDVVVESADAEGTIFDGRATIRTDDGTVTLSEATVVSDRTDALSGTVPEGVEVPLTVALVQFAEQSLHFYTPPRESTPTYRVETDEGVLGETKLTRRFPDVSAGIELDHPDLVGWVYEPVDSQSGPGVLLLHGSGGSPMRTTAALLAEHGYTAVALQYFDAPPLSEALSEVPLAYIETAAEFLRTFETVGSEQIGLYGGSRGGELALLAASTFDGFGPVVSVAGSGVVFEGSDNGLPTNTSTWTHDGEPVPYIPFRGVDSLEMADEADLQRATIPVEGIDDRVLLLSGADDTLWPSAALQQIAADRLAEHGHSEFEHVVYEQTGHYFIEPYVPIMGATEHGGELAGCAIASHDHWPKVLETLSSLK
ncbi:dienelactone hydrolase-like enzyme [Halovivax ruber XH-70]|uniref:Dienelactone hydrolase-like enzyme n=1 Tax=Halovivax ruber (strain DSM 18193 / JCM 13892 / XH-70) TaxID=797302 RepID=L0IEL5_HALRX|nr:acyl-CoA thioester hydrolase/BAAT C-terminal domain-containing protein [Halovivax ruber]AGB16666.1 dienelactone hydrolase-like enzyme [Halovivax ruber XH-70]